MPKLIFRYTIILFMSCSTMVNADDDRQTSFLKAVKNQLLMPDSALLQTRLKALDGNLKKLLDNISREQIQQVQSSYSDLVKAWKRVDTIYLAGNLDSDYLDHPRIIDHFHQGNESIQALLERSLQSDQALTKSLFKNSTRSINALDYLLFPKTVIESESAIWANHSSRRIRMATFVVEHLTDLVNEIAEFYRTEQQFVQGASQSLDTVINALVSSSYQLKNWRIGEAGGLVAKTEGKPSPHRLEYYYSGQSRAAVIAILQTHQRVFEIGHQSGYFQSNNEAAQGSIAFIEQSIATALKSANAIQGDLAQALESEAYRALFRALVKLHDAYYFTLIDALGIQAQMVDADGD